MNAKVKDFLVKYTMVLVLLIVFVLFNQMTGGKMIYAQNLSNLLLQNAYVVILACGMLLCILTGGNIDLSVGSVVCLVGAIAAKLLSTTSIPAIGIILLGLVVAAVIGVWQGYWIGYSRIPPFITTLAGMFVFRGLGRSRGWGPALHPASVPWSSGCHRSRPPPARCGPRDQRA